METKNYQKFSLMLAVSFVIMYLVMFLNVDALSHIYFSLTRTYMALLMVSPMALLMLLLMPAMYKNKTFNRIIAISSIAVFVLALVFLRNQIPIQDEQYMKAMIPHHSSAIMVSKNADLKDAEVKKLSVQIIKSQEEEIMQMKEILKRMEK
jgi:endonuclease/exonuclease/phosphatase (EEP) superfamily protein YafD